ncbi:hypothetical protein AXF42_Ash012275 [Apostasia shenzhenica]|uniref:Uncharacterized protein n=1 Tax=Apostasia shenzhenica TaxID=1088818 RepID=A0A2I0B4G5_9ASPA|nr:hypothetical protein AXF42_Ash012275 [Apostasia shenzhenica]
MRRANEEVSVVKLEPRCPPGNQMLALVSRQLGGFVNGRLVKDGTKQQGQVEQVEVVGTGHKWTNLS